MACRFHLGQSWWRKIQSESSLRESYINTNDELGKWLNDYILNNYIGDKCLVPPELWVEKPSMNPSLSSERTRRFCASSFTSLLSKPVSLWQDDVWGCTENPILVGPRCVLSLDRVFGYTTKKFRGRLHSFGEVVLRTTDHNHVLNKRKIEAKETIENLKETAKNTQLTTHCVVTQSVAGQLQSLNRIKRTVQRIRKIETCAPPIPKSLNDLKIPDEYREITSGETFLQYDSDNYDGYLDRFLIFTTEQNLNLMEICDYWLADGTFSCSPHIFHQLYTIHGVSYLYVVPTAYILLPNKKEETFYKRMFLALKTLHPQLRPKFIMFDFEKGAMNAAKYVFLAVDIKSCFFHLCQKNFAFAYIPENYVVFVFETFLESQFYQQEMLSNLIGYFEDTWIGRPNRRTRRAPLFSIKTWNCYSMLENDIPRTKQFSGRLAYFFHSMLSMYHPLI
ncbi:Uncharacterized protein FWK35_00029148 [Aphis craccivora]|uniref:MULE transposase domain-containing protein n=1 Tax=Aphis craccivora TaxID=307492 RepID=A0A6G0W0A4_APHCR|nr:Uncharacterized protein FWK35_00029148 [Aphis craccivora]